MQKKGSMQFESLIKLADIQLKVSRKKKKTEQINYITR